MRELKEALVSLMADHDLSATEGTRVLEVKSAGVNKGRAAHRWMCREDGGFIFVVGDNHTDEDVFEVAPDGAWTIKVGLGPTHAAYSVREPGDIRRLLDDMATGGA